MKDRIFKVMNLILVLLILGLGYTIFIMLTGHAMPCIFRYLTGFNCPTCGITRQILAFLNLDIETSKNFNIVLFYMYPFLLIFILYVIYRYIRYGIIKFNTFEIIYFTLICIIFLIWGIYRNLHML